MYGLVGRLTVVVVRAGASSLGSLAETSILVGADKSSSETSQGYVPRPLTFGDSRESRSIGCRRAFEDRIEAVSLSRSSALTDVRAEERSGELV